MAKALNAGQRKFCEGVVVGLTQQAAYMAAYPKASPKVATNRSTELMKKQAVLDYIAELRRNVDDTAAAIQAKGQQQAAVILKAEQVLSVLSGIAKGEPQKVTDKLTGKDVYERPKTIERLRAAELMAKHYGLLTEKIEQDTDIHITVDERIKEIGQ